jgi:hypothetical protein
MLGSQVACFRSFFQVTSEPFKAWEGTFHHHFVAGYFAVIKVLEEQHTWQSDA